MRITLHQHVHLTHDTHHSPRAAHTADRLPPCASKGGKLNRWSSTRLAVPPRGFEPLISALKGLRPRPLDDGGQNDGRRATGGGRSCLRRPPSIVRRRW